MKVLAIITYYHPHWTGLTSHAVRVAEALAARGHEVTVLTTRHSSTLPSLETRHGVEIVRLRPIARLSRGMIAPSFLLVAARYIRQSDVVQIHTPLPEALWVAMFCQTLERPLVMTHHGDVVMPPGRSNQAIEKIARGLLKKTASLADAVTSYSRDYAEHSPVLFPVLDRVTPSGRNTARAAVGGEFPTRTLSVVRRDPSSTIAHVSASPPLIPDSRISRVRLAAAAFPRGPSQAPRSLSTRLHTPLGCIVIPPARHHWNLTSLYLAQSPDDVPK